ncbi:MAG: hypothetical protein HQK99_12315 [Nitrospirae bacterium]|nr:hypothetical protein [Nitrospirota bacterium]
MANHGINLDNSKTYTFKVVVEPDEDRWFVYCPLAARHGSRCMGLYSGRIPQKHTRSSGNDG